MTSIESQLLKALRELEDAVAGMQTAQSKPDLLAIFAKIDGLAQDLPEDTNPGLLHYLRKKSYQKARLFLEGRDSESFQTGNTMGSCGHQA